MVAPQYHVSYRIPKLCAFSCLGLVGEKSIRIGVDIPTGSNVGRQKPTTPAPPTSLCMSPPDGLTSKETETTLVLSWSPPKCHVKPDFYKVVYTKLFAVTFASMQKLMDQNVKVHSH